METREGTGAQAPEPDWRNAVLVTTARVVAVIGLVPVLVGMLEAPGDALPLAAMALPLVAACAFVGWSKRLGLRTRAVILLVPLFFAGILSTWAFGATAGAVITLANWTVIVGLVGGRAAGAAAVAATTLGLAITGYLGRESIIARVIEQYPDPLTWVRMGAIYALGAGLLLVVATRAVSQVEAGARRARNAMAREQKEGQRRREAEEELRTSEARLRLALGAAGAATWELDAETLGYVWTADAARLIGVPLELMPARFDEFLTWVPEQHRERLRRLLDDVIAERVPEHRSVFPVSPPGRAEMWLEVHGSLVPTANGGRRCVTGTVIDVTARHLQEQRRADAQAALLYLSTSPAASDGELAQALAEITEAGTRLLDVERCGVWLFNERATVIEAADLHLRSADRHEHGAVLRADANPAYFEALMSQRAVAAHDARTDPRTQSFADSYLVPNRIASMLDSPIHAGGRLCGVLCHEHVGDRPRTWSPDDESMAAALADCASRALESASRVEAEADLRRAYAELRQVTRRLEAAKEEERRHIARELHDELGQSLTAIKMSLGLIARDGAGDAAKKRLEETVAVVDRAIASTRELSRAMRPPLLDELGLGPALQAFVDEQRKLSPALGFAIELDGLPRRLPAEVEIAAFRIVQEAATNVLRHAQATRVKIAVHADSQALELSIADDGRGFGQAQAAARAADGHLGIPGMRERARALGGMLEIDSAAGRGTTVHVRLPIGGAA